MGMAVLPAVGTKKYVGAIIGINVSRLSLLSTVMGAPVTNLQVVWKQRDISGMVLETIEVACSRMFFCLFRARFASEVYKL